MPIVERKTLIIMRGLPGSGKSTIAGFFKDAIVISMDKFWTREGRPYKFDKTQIDEAVRWTHNAFEQALDLQDFIVLDNTNSREWEYEWFRQRAQERGFVVYLLEAQRSIFDCFASCSHGVSFAKIREMAERFERPADMSEGNRLRQLEDISAARLAQSVPSSL